MTQQEVVQFWLIKSHEEISAARIMFSAGHYMYTGFMCHQAIEKSLKAYYIHLNNKRQPQEHNLVKLIAMTKLNTLLDDKHISTIENLNPLYIKTRYEDYKNKIAELLTKSYCSALLTDTEDLLTWITQLMKQ